MAEIVGIIASDCGDVDAILQRVSENCGQNLAREVILSLSDKGASAVKFFDWMVKNSPDLGSDPGMCNLFVDNLGRIGDYARMMILLEEISRRGHCLTEKAFLFLKPSIFSPDMGSAVDLLRRILQILRKVGGSALGSGIFSLIKFLADSGSFDLAILVIEEMRAPRVNYFNALIAAKCRRGNFEDAHNLFDEMRNRGCTPNTQSFNYLLGSLYKNDKFEQARELLRLMETSGCTPDALTYEVMIVNACRVNRFDLAGEFLSRMLTEGIRPRLTTHSAFIKRLFRSGGLTEARGYIDFVSKVDGSATNMNYSLLASLLRINGRLAEAANILQEMMVTNLRPNFYVYVRLTKDLYRAGHGELAAALKHQFLEFDRRHEPTSSS